MSPVGVLEWLLKRSSTSVNEFGPIWSYKGFSRQCGRESSGFPNSIVIRVVEAFIVDPIRRKVCNGSILHLLLETYLSAVRFHLINTVKISKSRQKMTIRTVRPIKTFLFSIFHATVSNDLWIFLVSHRCVGIILAIRHVRSVGTYIICHWRENQKWKIAENPVNLFSPSPVNI